MGGESCTVLRLRFMHKLAMSHNRRRGAGRGEGEGGGLLRSYYWALCDSMSGNTILI